MKSKSKVKPSWDRREPAFEHAAIGILQQANCPLTLREITDEIVSQGLVTIRGKTPDKTLYAIIKRKEELRLQRGLDAIFQKTIDGRSVKFSLKSKNMNINEEASGSVPHPVPYQGSKRKLAGRIIGLLQGDSIENLFEPFSGSAAFTIASAQRNIAKHFFINDSLKPLAELWSQVINKPEALAQRYSTIWSGHVGDPLGNFYKVRAEFNQDSEPAKLLYLLARCVKSAVRFNDKGEFNQSADKRRLGTQPARMQREILAAHYLLRGRATASSLDYAEAMSDARHSDVVYMDPPWQGTSGSKDTRYHQILDRERLIQQLDDLNRRSIPFLLSFDGRLGDKEYGEALPSELNLTRLEINAGRSSQATLSGRDDETIESVYVSNTIVMRLQRSGLEPMLSAYLPKPTHSAKKGEDVQCSLI